MNQFKQFIKRHPLLRNLGVKIIKQWHMIKYQWRLWWFRHSPNTRRLHKLHNIHAGKRCFIIGNGPSLRGSDLEELKGEITFASNRVFNIYDQTSWRPTYYCAQDFVLIDKIQQEISQLECEQRLIAINACWQYRLKFPTALYFYLDLTPWVDHQPQFSVDITQAIHEGFTVTYAAIQLAYYMGFKEIYLLGIDHNYSTVINNDGVITHDPTVRDYFSQDSNQALNLPNLDQSTQAYIKAQAMANQLGFKVFNATRGGKLEVFPRVDFDNLMMLKGSNQ